MINLKKQLALLLFLCTPIHSMELALLEPSADNMQSNWHLLSTDILIQKITPLLDFKSKNNLGKTCKSYYEAIQPATLSLTKEECKNLNLTDYTKAMIYYSQKNNEEKINFLLINSKKSHVSSTRDLILFLTHEYYLGHIISWYKNTLDEIGGTTLHFIVMNEECRENIHRDLTIYTLVTLFSNTPHIDVNTQDECGNTPLLYAVMRHNRKFQKKDIASILLENQLIDVSIKNNEGKTLLHYNPSDRHLQLLNNRIDVNTQDNDGNTPLHCATKTKHILYLLNHKDIEVNIPNNLGETPLHFSIRNRTSLRSNQYRDHKKYAKKYHLLLKHLPVNVNAKNNKGETPLHYAAQYKSFDADWPYRFEARFTIEQLLDRTDIDVNIKNNNGETPLDYALKANDYEVIRLLKKRGGVSGSLVVRHKTKIISLFGILCASIAAYLYYNMAQK